LHDPDSDPPSVSDSELLVTFNGMAYGGDAVGRTGESGLAVFAWPGIEGERARVLVTSQRKNLLRGLVTEVLEPSSLRVEPPCPYFGPCGGCQWQHIEYAGQVAFKDAILRSQLERIGGLSGLDEVMRPPIPAPNPYHYRNTSHFAIHVAERSLGYFTRDTHTVVPVAHCPISNAGINTAIPLVNSLLELASTEEGEGAPVKGVMRLWQVTIRSSEQTGNTLVLLHSRAEGAAKPRHRRGERSHEPARPERGPGLEPTPEAAPEMRLPRRAVKRAVAALTRGSDTEEQAGLTVLEIMEDGTLISLGGSRGAGSLTADMAADALSGMSLAESVKRVEGAGSGPPAGAWVERLGGLNYWVAPEAFFQVNSAAAELLLAEVAEHIPENLGLLVDAHSGVGTFALSFARRAKRALAFESNSAAVASGRWTAAAYNLSNVEFRAGRAEQLLARLPRSERPDLILLDPPRSGCHPALLDEIMARGIPRIVYVSCDPSTLARDLKQLSSTYDVASARVVDMFPQTFHLETVALLDGRG
jgi:23S rRNA (uracil1939-C5)-methyltransferase